jgi:hypothetical protein
MLNANPCLTWWMKPEKYYWVLEKLAVFHNKWHEIQHNDKNLLIRLMSISLQNTVMSNFEWLIEIKTFTSLQQVVRLCECRYFQQNMVFWWISFSFKKSRGFHWQPIIPATHYSVMFTSQYCHIWTCDYWIHSSLRFTLMFCRTSLVFFPWVTVLISIRPGSSKMAWGPVPCWILWREYLQNALIWFSSCSW